jgi:hypothetical protein
MRANIDSFLSLQPLNQVILDTCVFNSLFDIIQIIKERLDKLQHYLQNEDLLNHLSEGEWSKEKGDYTFRFSEAVEKEVKFRMSESSNEYASARPLLYQINSEIVKTPVYKQLKEITQLVEDKWKYMKSEERRKELFEDFRKDYQNFGKSLEGEEWKDDYNPFESGEEWKDE